LGGELGLPLAGAVGGAALGLRWRPGSAGAVSVGVIGLFAVLVVGRFFGELRTLHGVILLATPLLVCVLALLPRQVSSAWLRGAVAVVVVALPIALVVIQARARFVQASGARSSSGEVTVDDSLESR
jgi:hypothetical protein